MSIDNAVSYYHNRSQYGASSTEFTIIATLVLALAMCIYEVTRAQALRQLMQQALLEGARAAAVHHLDPKALSQRFNEAMLPWWSGNSLPPEQAQQHSYLRFQTQYQLHPWQITILSPSAQSFALYADTRARLEVGTPFPTINNHYQHEHHSGLLKISRDTLMPPLQPFQSKPTLFEANTITLQGIYLYEPSLLPIRAFIASVSPFIGTSNYTQQALAQGLVPLQVKLSVGAQSHPVQWPISVHDAIQHANTSQDPVMPSTYVRSH